MIIDDYQFDICDRRKSNFIAIVVGLVNDTKMLTQSFAKIASINGKIKRSFCNRISSSRSGVVMLSYSHVPSKIPQKSEPFRMMTG